MPLRAATPARACPLLRTPAQQGSILELPYHVSDHLRPHSLSVNSLRTTPVSRPWFSKLGAVEGGETGVVLEGVLLRRHGLDPDTKNTPRGALSIVGQLNRGA